MVFAEITIDKNHWHSFRELAKRRDPLIVSSIGTFFYFLS